MRWLWSLIPVTFITDGGPTDQPINDLGVNVLNNEPSTFKVAHGNI